MRIAGIIKDSIVDGEGIRDVIFVQGCTHYCKGCHNPNTWNLDGGTEMSIPQIVEELNGSPNNITISGGEPLRDAKEIIKLLKTLAIIYPNKTVWVYTGYTWEELSYLLKYEMVTSTNVEVVVDGKFMEELKDSSLQFRGSSNQRLIDLECSILSNKIVSWEETK